MISDSIIAKTTNKYIYGTINWTSTLDVAKNQSTVTATMVLRKYYHYPDCVKKSDGIGTWNLYINGIRKTITEYKNFDFGVDVTVISNSIIVPHNADGSKNCNISVTGGMPAGNSYTETFAGKDVDLELNVQQALITNAVNFTDLENPTINFSNSRNYPVQFKIEDTTGYNNLIVTDKLVEYNKDYYTFELDETQRNILRDASKNANPFPIRFTVSSYIPADSGSPTYFSWMDKQLTVVDGEPTFTNFHHEDINPVSLALTGDSSIYIQNISQCKRWVAEAEKMVANKYATPKGYSALYGNTNYYSNYYPTGDIIFPTVNINFDTPILKVNAIDSRGKTTTVEKNINLIKFDRSNNHFSALVKRATTVSNTVNATGSGTYTPLVIGGIQKNVVNINIKYKKEGALVWEFEENFNASVHIDGSFDFGKTYSLSTQYAYNFDVTASDIYGNINNVYHLSIGKGEALLYMGTDKRIGINKLPDIGNTKEGLYIKKEDQLWDQIYPVGSCILMIYGSGIGDITAGGTWIDAGQINTTTDILQVFYRES